MIHIFFQVVDEFDTEVGEPFPGREEHVHLGVGDAIKFAPPLKVEGWSEWPDGIFSVQSREWRVRRYAVNKSVVVESSLTIIIRLI